MNHPETHGKKKEKRGDKGPIYKSVLHIFFLIVSLNNVNS